MVRDIYSKEMAKLRKTLIRLLGGFPRKCSLNARVVSVEEREQFFLESVIYQSRPEEQITAYLLKPKEFKDKSPAIIYIHGHTEYGIGKADALKKPIASELCRQGYMIICPDSKCFGERMIPGFSGSDGERLIAMNCLLDGKTWAGQQVWDIMRTVDYLESRDDVDTSRVGCYGMSMGGFECYFTSALDQRIKVAVVAGALSTFESVIKEKWIVAYDFYIPNIRKYADVWDIYSLIAPRALLIAAGNADPHFPRYAAEQIYQRTRETYRALGAPEKLKIVEENCGHEVTERMRDEIVKWFKKQL